MANSNRYSVPDIIRGIAIISMIVYHALWDIVYIFDQDIPWFKSTAAGIFQMSIRWTFILISGFCFSLGKNHLKRAIIVIAAAFSVSIITHFFTPESEIIHGVLTLIGLSMLLTIPLEKIFRKTPPYIAIIVCIVLFTLFYDIELRKLGIGSYNVELPDFLYRNNFTAIFGFRPRKFSSSDYVPLLPWIFMFWIGHFIYLVFEKHQLLKYLSCINFPPLEYIGRKSLIIYLLHQPIIYGILYLIFNII